MILQNQNRIIFRTKNGMEGLDMAKINEALELCVQIGKILSETSEFQNMRKAEEDLLHNEQPRQIVENLQKLQIEIQQKKLAGLPLTEEDKKRMQEAEAVALQNPMVKASFEAHEKFQGVMTLVSAKIREGIRSSEQPQMVDDEDEQEE